MRDPGRIDIVTVALAEAWRQNPDLRFGQFMLNFFWHSVKDPFFPEDGGWLAAFQAYANGGDPRKAMEEHRYDLIGKSTDSLSDETLAAYLFFKDQQK